MYLSRTDQPLKKWDNDKGSIKLKNHCQAILELGQVWVDNYVTEKLFIVDLTDQTGESYIEMSKDFIQFPHSNHKVIMCSTLDKLGNYLKHNQRFKVDKKKKTIDVSLIPPNVQQLPFQWCVQINMQELHHQVCFIQYRCQDDACFSQCHHNNMCLQELYELFDWSIYESEQKQMLCMSVQERNLSLLHNESHLDACQTKKAISNHKVRMVQIFPPPPYTIEKHMPLSKTL